ARKISRKELSDYVVPGSCLDLTPFNLIEADEGLVPIDMEWSVDRDIPFGWVVTRSIVHCLGVGVDTQNSIRSVAGVVRSLCSAEGLDVCEGEIDEWLELESSLQAIVVVPHRMLNGLLSFREALVNRDGRVAALDKLLIERQEAVFERDRRV